MSTWRPSTIPLSRAILKCRACGYQVRVEWQAGDRPLYLDEFYEEHCGQPLEQITHNDGETPLDDPCPSYCCPRPG